jgi:hypothetical protein
MSTRFADTEAKKSWLSELAEHKKGNTERNHERILVLEGFQG